MFRIEHTYLFWLCLLIPVFIFVFIYFTNWRKKAIHKIGDTLLLSKMISGYSRSRVIWKRFLFTLCIVLLIIAWSNPQIGSREIEVKREGIDLAIALDVSNSMLAEDLMPNRLERAKLGILQLIDQLKGDRISIIVFAGQAYVQLPITSDYAAAKLFVSTIQPGIIPVQGTAIGKAIDLAVESLGNQMKSKKSIVVITDGENHEDDAISYATEAYSQGVIVHTIGMGSEQGAPIPIYKGKQRVGFKSDKQGSPVMSKLNQSMLQDIAKGGNGIYVRANNAQSGLQVVLDEINRMEKTEFETKLFADYDDKFQYFLFPAIILLILELMIPEKVLKESKFKKWLNSAKK